jgi:hypothetical protein
MIVQNLLPSLPYKAHNRVFRYLLMLKNSADPAAQTQYAGLAYFLRHLASQTMPCHVLTQKGTGLVDRHLVHIHNHVLKIFEQRGVFGTTYYIDNIMIHGGAWQP